MSDNTKKISAKELIGDIKAGMDDVALCNKYKLSTENLSKLCERLIRLGYITRDEPDQRRTVAFSWKCPRCGRPQPHVPGVCPDCGVITSKLSPPDKAKTRNQDTDTKEGAFTCPLCGKSQDPNASFCSGCGASLTELEEWECLACGAKHQNSFEKCPTCGLTAANVQRGTSIEGAERQRDSTRASRVNGIERRTGIPKQRLLLVLVAGIAVLGFGLVLIMPRSIDSMPAYRTMKREIYRISKQLETGVTLLEHREAQRRFTTALADLELHLEGRHKDIVNELTSAAKCLTSAHNSWVPTLITNASVDHSRQNSWRDFRKHCVTAMFMAEHPREYEWNQFLTYVRIRQEEAVVQQRLEENRKIIRILEERGREFIEAAKSGALETAQEIAEKGVLVDAKDENGDTALIIAARDGNVEMVRLLIEQAADLNARNMEGETALMQISEKDSLIIPLLLDYGADPEVEDNDGETALERSARAGLVDRVDLLDTTDR